jgi:hypothetical protein
MLSMRPAKGPGMPTGDFENKTGYSNPRVDELIEKIGREMVTYGATR